MRRQANFIIGLAGSGAAFAATGCADRPDICIITAREVGQAENELRRFLSHHAESKNNGDFSFTCSALGPEVRDELSADEDLYVVETEVDGVTYQAEFIRKSSQSAEDFVRDHADAIDVVWGLGVGYVLRLEDVLDDELGGGVYHRYAPQGLEALQGDISTWDGSSAWQWFVDPDCASSDGCVPKFVATTAYINNVCFNGQGLDDLALVDCSCRDTAEGCDGSQACPAASLCPEIFPFDSDKREYSWTELLCTPELRGHIAMPRPDQSGTGLIAVYALMASGEIEGVSSVSSDAVEPTLKWLESFHETQSVVFTSSGSTPCQEVLEGPEILIGISNDSAFRDIQEAASVEGTPIQVTEGTLSTGVGYEPEATAILMHDDSDDSLSRLQSLGASTFVDWWASTDGRTEASQTSSVVVHRNGTTSNAGTCSADCIASWASIPFDAVPKLGLQQGFPIVVCDDEANGCAE